VSYPLPPDTRSVGSPNPSGDMNEETDALLGMGEAGYVKPSGDTSGATDTAAVTAAEATGGPVFFDSGTYWGNFTKATGTVWKGSGRAQTIMKAPAASNAPVLTSTGFAGLTLTGSQGGITSFALRDMTFDGNASNQSIPAAFGVGLYGCDYLLDNVTVRNCLAVDPLYTEWSSSGSASSTPDKSMEAMFRFLRVHDNTATGAAWHNRGPHDSTIFGCWIYNNSTSAYGYWPEATYSTYTAAGLSGTAVSSTPATVTLNTTLNLPVAGTATMPSAGGTVTLTWTGTTATTLTGVSAAGGSGNYSSNTVTPVCQYSAAADVAYGMHVWGSHSIAVVCDASAMFEACEAEGASTGMALFRAPGGAQWNGGKIFNGGASAYAVQLGDTTNQALGTVLNWPVITGFTGGATTKAYLNVVNEAQGHYEALCLLSGTNQALYGTLAVSSHRKVIFEGGGSVTPSIVVGANAGTGGAPAASVSSATDLRGQASWTTGSASMAPGVQATVTFAQPKPGIPAIAIWPATGATAALLPYVTGISATSFQIAVNGTPGAGATYQVGFADVTG
jgi:hypothetical protein